MAIRIPLGLCVVLVRRKEKRIPTSGFALLGMTMVGWAVAAICSAYNAEIGAAVFVYALGSPLRGAGERKRD